jgi:hypothetical protein
MLRIAMSERRILIVALGCVLLVLETLPALATPTGLNNIPTADVVPKGILVLQAFANFGGRGDASWLGGLKFGPADNWEVGLDGEVSGPGSGGGPTLQAKYTMPLRKGVRLALGAANVSGDRDGHGNVFPYLVASVPLGERSNGHFGYSLESGNHALFLGADAAVSASLTLRSDWIQANDANESVWSLGFISPVAKRCLVEGWASFPSAAGAETNYVLKVDYIVPLAR